MNIVLSYKATAKKAPLSFDRKAVLPTPPKIFRPDPTKKLVKHFGWFAQNETCAGLRIFFHIRIKQLRQPIENGNEAENAILLKQFAIFSALLSI
jgi:hypothetical protein